MLCLNYCPMQGNGFSPMFSYKLCSCSSLSSLSLLSSFPLPPFFLDRVSQCSLGHLELLILLLQPPKCWDYSHVPPCPGIVFLKLQHNFVLFLSVCLFFPIILVGTSSILLNKWWEWIGGALFFIFGEKIVQTFTIKFNINCRSCSVFVFNRLSRQKFLLYF